MDIPEHIMLLVKSGKAYEELKPIVENLDLDLDEKKKGILLSRVYDEVTRQMIKSQNQREALLLTIGGGFFFAICVILFSRSEAMIDMTPWALGVIVSGVIFRRGAKLQQKEVILPHEERKNRKLFDRF